MKWKPWVQAVSLHCCFSIDQLCYATMSSFPLPPAAMYSLGVLALAVALSWSWFSVARRLRPLPEAILAIVVAAGVASFSTYGNSANLIKVDGHIRNLKVHDFAHYYLGSAFFEELGYTGIYRCTALALRELADEHRITLRYGLSQIRDLEDKTRIIKGSAVFEGAATCRARFSEARWRQFRDDVERLVTVDPRLDWQFILIDHGYNPSPVYTWYGRMVAAVLPLKPFLFLLSTLDIFLLLGLAFLLWRQVGAVPTLAALCAFLLFPGGNYATWNWLGGSFLRFTWLVWLVLAWLFLKRERHLIAGICFGFAVMERVFPLFFFAAALWPLTMKFFAGRRTAVVPANTPEGASRPRETLRQIAGLCGGFLGACILLLALTSLLYGPGTWGTFVGYIAEHSKQFALNTTGFKKVAVYTPDLAGSVGNYDSSERLGAWWDLTNKRWDNWPLNKVILAAIVAAGAAASLRLDVVVSSILLGSCLLYSLTLSAHYYGCYLSFAIAFLLKPSGHADRTKARSSRNIALIAGALAFYLASSNAFYLFVGDRIQVSFAVSLLFLLFLLVASLGTLLPRWQGAAAVCAACAVLAAVGYARQRPLDNARPPPVFGRSGAALVYDDQPGLRPLSARHADVHGYSVADAGRALIGGSLRAEVALPEARDRKLVIRCETTDAGFLTVVVNDSWQARVNKTPLGTYFDYTEFDVPASAWRSGGNVIRLHWFGSRPLGVYSSWAI